MFVMVVETRAPRENMHHSTKKGYALGRNQTQNPLAVRQLSSNEHHAGRTMAQSNARPEKPPPKPLGNETVYFQGSNSVYLSVNHDRQLNSIQMLKYHGPRFAHVGSLLHCHGLLGHFNRMEP